ncbi:MAG: CocE/NonD family hydrolase [Actinomycetota bacterium]
MLARKFLLTFVAIGLLLQPGTAGSEEPPQRQAPEEWIPQLSRAIYSQVVRTTHYIAAEDGSQLSLTVHLPQGLPVGTKVPTLLQLTPYRPLDQALGGYGSFEYFVKRGAAYVEADERGTGGSQGCLDFGGSLDRSDARVFANWIRSQPWSNGKIVTDGISHPGMGSVSAHAAVPGLTGALAHAPVVSYYQDEWLQGAKFEDQFNGPLYQAIELAPPLPPEFEGADAIEGQVAPCTGRTTLDYSWPTGEFSPLWADRDLSRHIEHPETPILLTHGFVDMNVHPDHSQLYWDALRDDAPKYGIFGWWYHGWPSMNGHPFDRFDHVRHRWLDALLFERDNGLWAEPRVLVEDNTHVWHEGHDWPLEQSTEVVLRPASGGALQEGAPAAGQASYPDMPGSIRGKWTGAHVAFRTDPFAKDMLINGAPQLDLVGSSNLTETKWVAYLMEETPDGRWHRITHGYADSHTWNGEDKWEVMTPGTKYEWTLRLLPTAFVVPEGSRLTLVITSQDSRNVDDPRQSGDDACWEDYRGGCYAPSGILPAATMGAATNTVYLGPDGTSLRLAWVDPNITAKPPWDHDTNWPPIVP